MVPHLTRAGFGLQARFLLEEAGVKEEKIAKVITMQPELIRCSLSDKLLVLVKYLRSKGFKAWQIGAMIEDFPALLMYSVPAVHPKFQYLTKAMKRSLADAVTFPRSVKILPSSVCLETSSKSVSFSVLGIPTVIYYLCPTLLCPFHPNVLSQNGVPFGICFLKLFFHGYRSWGG